ncbi:HAD hydrolase family protein [Halopseudomonas aestusnigri]|uniref:HAD hydrolase family protein n=1 Tax=Halopseudomonas aestusnigri TaxID=857252 RepID=UPI00300223A5
MKKIIIDLDGTLTIDSPGRYEDKLPNLAVIERLKDYKEKGFLICVNTARNMRTYNGNLGQINIHTLPVILSWLKVNGVPYDEVIVGKPWCGTEGFYVDDRAIRPGEFARLSLEEIKVLLSEDARVGES